MLCNFWALCGILSRSEAPHTSSGYLPWRIKAIYFLSARFYPWTLICELSVPLGLKAHAVCAWVLELEWCQATEVNKLPQVQSKWISLRESHEWRKFLASHLFLMTTKVYPFSSINTPKCLQTFNMSLLMCFSSSPNMSTTHRSAFFPASYQFPCLPLNFLQFAFLSKDMRAAADHSTQKLRWAI